MSAATVPSVHLSADGQSLLIESCNCADAHGVDRRSRAASINGAKRAYERANGVTLTLASRSYSETWGFLHSSEFRYEVRPAS